MDRFHIHSGATDLEPDTHMQLPDNRVGTPGNSQTESISKTPLSPELHALYIRLAESASAIAGEIGQDFISIQDYNRRLGLLVRIRQLTGWTTEEVLQYSPIQLCIESRRLSSVRNKQRSLDDYLPAVLAECTEKQTTTITIGWILLHCKKLYQWINDQQYSRTNPVSPETLWEQLKVACAAHGISLDTSITRASSARNTKRQTRNRISSPHTEPFGSDERVQEQPIDARVAQLVTALEKTNPGRWSPAFLSRHISSPDARQIRSAFGDGTTVMWSKVLPLLSQTWQDRFDYVQRPEESVLAVDNEERTLYLQNRKKAYIRQLHAILTEHFCADENHQAAASDCAKIHQEKITPSAIAKFDQHLVASINELLKLDASCTWFSIIEELGDPWNTCFDIATRSVETYADRIVQLARRDQWRVWNEHTLDPQLFLRIDAILRRRGTNWTELVALLPDDIRNLYSPIMPGVHRSNQREVASCAIDLETYLRSTGSTTWRRSEILDQNPELFDRVQQLGGIRTLIPFLSTELLEQFATQSPYMQAAVLAERMRRELVLLQNKPWKLSDFSEDIRTRVEAYIDGGKMQLLLGLLPAPIRTQYTDRIDNSGTKHDSLIPSADEIGAIDALLVANRYQESGVLNSALFTQLVRAVRTGNAYARIVANYVLESFLLQNEIDITVYGTDLFDQIRSFKLPKDISEKEFAVSLLYRLTCSPTHTKKHTKPTSHQAHKSAPRSLDTAVPAADITGAYFSEIRQFARISPERERELGNRIQASDGVDHEALQELITANLALVISVAKKYLNRGLTFDELIQEGNIGLMKAARKFDPLRGYRFSTMAVWWIKQAIREAIVLTGRTIRLPGGAFQQVVAYSKARDSLSRLLNRDPTTAEVASHMGIPIERVSLLDERLHAPSSLETPLRSRNDKGKKEGTLGKIIEDSSVQDPEALIAREQFVTKVRTALQQLTPQQQQIVTMLFGLDGDDEMSPTAISDMLGCTPQNVYDLRKRVFAILREDTTLQSLRSVPQ